METVILAVLVAVELAGALLLRRIARRLEKLTPRSEELEEAAQPAKKPDPMDEGFENLMRYAVRGATGFEREEE